MSYIPTEWKTGDVVTAEKLNNIEDGIASNETLLIEMDYVNGESSDVYIKSTSMTPSAFFTKGVPFHAMQKMPPVYDYGEKIGVAIEYASAERVIYLSDISYIVLVFGSAGFNMIFGDLTNDVWMLELEEYEQPK